MPLYYEDFQAGQQWELGQYQLSEESIIKFARKFDPQYFHIDPVKAKDSIYGGLVASNWQTMAIYMKLIVEGLISRSVSLGSPGIDEIRFFEPVRPGDTLQVRYMVTECRTSNSRPTVGIVHFKGEVYNQAQEPVASVAGTGFFGRKPPEDI
ncbi:MAG: dehydratase [Chloroflexi bacterium]|jgi:acyl dehydratase|nr:dehydratase [Chloroflexota bacterium]